MALKMKFLESSPINAEDQIRYPVSYANGIYLRDGTRTVQDFIDSFNVNNGGDNSINLPKDCVNTNQIVNYAVTSGKIAASAIIEEKIADNAITNAKIISYNKEQKIGGLDGDKLKDNAVTEDKIADGAVTLKKATFGQIDMIGTHFKDGDDNAEDPSPSVFKVDGYRILVLGVRGNEDGGLLATTIFPLAQFTGKEENDKDKISTFSVRYTENGVFDDYNGAPHNFVFCAIGRLSTDDNEQTWCSVSCTKYNYGTQAILWGIK